MDGFRYVVDDALSDQIIDGKIKLEDIPEEIRFGCGTSIYIGAFRVSRHDLERFRAVVRVVIDDIFERLHYPEKKPREILHCYSSEDLIKLLYMQLEFVDFGEEYEKFLEEEIKPFERELERRRKSFEK